MKTILLAVDGMTMHKSALDYALSLCHPVRAGLDIVQIIRPLALPRGLGKLKKKVLRAQKAFENFMITSTYAEAGVPDLAGTMERKNMRRLKKLLPADVNTPIDYHCLVTREDPDATLIQYLATHQNVALAIYDAICTKSRDAVEPALNVGISKNLANRLPIPLILVRDA